MRKNNQHGFSLIEMMVGVALGLLGMLAVSQVLLTFSANRRANTSTMETQNNGTMALYLLERDIAQAGYGLMNIQDCSTINWYFNTEQTPLTTLPIRITDGGAASDSIVVQYASSVDGVPITLISQGQTVYADPLIVSSIVGFVANNLAVADVGGVCTLYQVTGVNSLTGALAHAANTYNPAVAPGTGWGLVSVSNNLVNMGNFVSRSYSINSNNLISGVFPAYTTSTLVDGIAFMKAEYGRDTSGDGAVDVWSPATWVPTNATASQIVAIRIGIVARTTEQVAVSNPANFTLLPQITDAGGTVIGAQFNYTLPTATYRYKPYYTIIPMRNVIWSK